MSRKRRLRLLDPKQPATDPEAIPMEGHAVMADPPSPAQVAGQIRVLDPVNLAPNARVTLHMPKTEIAVVMLADPGGAWTPLILPPGSTWVLVPEDQAPQRAPLWTPPGVH